MAHQLTASDGTPRSSSVLGSAAGSSGYSHLDDVQRQHELMTALETATRWRNGAETRWRRAIAEAHAAGVGRDVILKAAGGWDAIEVEDILHGLPSVPTGRDAPRTPLPPRPRDERVPNVQRGHGLSGSAK